MLIPVVMYVEDRKYHYMSVGDTPGHMREELETSKNQLERYVGKPLEWDTIEDSNNMLIHYTKERDN